MPWLVVAEFISFLEKVRRKWEGMNDSTFAADAYVDTWGKRFSASASAAAVIVVWNVNCAPSLFPPANLVQLQQVAEEVQLSDPVSLFLSLWEGNDFFLVNGQHSTVHNTTGKLFFSLSLLRQIPSCYQLLI